VRGGGGRVRVCLMKSEAGDEIVRGKLAAQLDYKNASILGIYGFIMIISDMDSDSEGIVMLCSCTNSIKDYHTLATFGVVEKGEDLAN
jgi:hypothetical protein